MIDKLKERFSGDNRAQTVGVKAIGRGIFAVVLIGVVLNVFLTTGIVENSNGPVDLDQFVDIGVAAMVIAVIGFLVLAGSIAMGYLDRF